MTVMVWTLILTIRISANKSSQTGCGNAGPSLPSTSSGSRGAITAEGQWDSGAAAGEGSRNAAVVGYGYEKVNL